MPLKQIAVQLRNSLWFVPAIWVIGSGVLAFLMILIDSATPGVARSFPLIFGGGADGARGLLSSIASSAITVAGVTFSITIVALQLASSQFSPRVLRNFMRDRLSQAVLGSFIGTFLYSLLVLRSIRSQQSDAEQFVPSLAVTVGILFAVVAVAMLVYFIHHISNQIQVSNIVARIADETARGVETEWRDRDGDEADEPQAPSDAPALIPARASGYLELVDRSELVRLASRLDIVVLLEHRTGEWVQEKAPLFAVWPREVDSGELGRDLTSHITIGAQRSLEQDAAYGIRQLVDVAIKALSPGINDPTSANDCIHRLTQILVATGSRREPRRAHFDDAGKLRLVVNVRDFPELVGLAFDEIRHYGSTTPAIATSLAEAARTVMSAVREDRHEPIRRQVRLLLEDADRIQPPADREEVVACLSGVLAG